MTPKEHQLLSAVHEKLVAGNFGEADVVVGLTLLRNYVPNGPIRELALHVTHNVRDSGRFLNRVIDNKRVLDRMGRKPGVFVSGDVFTLDEFEKSLNHALGAFGLSTLSRPTVEMVLLCAISILQDARVTNGKASGSLSLALTADRVELCATMKIKHKGKEPAVRFPVLSVPNRWLPISNPRASLEAREVVRVNVQDSIPHIAGFKPFEVYIEREPPITWEDLERAIAADPRLRRVDGDALEFVPAKGEALRMVLGRGCVTLPGRPEYFRHGSEYAAAVARLGRNLSACVHDDAGAHWFLEPVELLGGVHMDGFHCHWVGRGSPTCTRPL